MDQYSFNSELLDFIRYSPTPFHAVRISSEILLKSGFEELKESSNWKITAGKYFVTRNSSSFIAFNIPSDDVISQGIAMSGAHTDSPCLKVKPNPIIQKNGYAQLGVEVYGGGLLFCS